MYDWLLNYDLLFKRITLSTKKTWGGVWFRRHYGYLPKGIIIATSYLKLCAIIDCLLNLASEFIYSSSCWMNLLSQNLPWQSSLSLLDVSYIEFHIIACMILLLVKGDLPKNNYITLRFIVI